MNKIYKIIWSRTKNCYVVASELAKSHGKSKSSVIKRSALSIGVMAILAGIIPVGQVAAVGSFIEDQNGIAITDKSSSGVNMATGEKSIAIGWTDLYRTVVYKVAANGDYSIVLGNGGKADGDESLAIGRYSATNSDGVISIGKWAGSFTGGDYVDKAKNSINIGSEANSLAENAIGIGTMVLAQGENSVSIGSSAIARGNNSTVLGTAAVANGNSSVALGKKAFVAGASGIAIGEHSLAEGERSMALGATGATEWDALLEREADGEKIPPDEKEAARLVWLSERTTAEGKDSLAMMNGAKAEGDNSIAVGTYAKSLAESSIAIGNKAEANGQKTVAIGNAVDAGGIGTVAIGHNIYTTDKSGFNRDNIAVGDRVYYTNSIGISGLGSSIDIKNAEDVLALGKYINVNGNNPNLSPSRSNVEDVVAIGRGVDISGSRSVAIGTGAKAGIIGEYTDEDENVVNEGISWVDANQVVAIGMSATAHHNDSIAMGSLAGAEEDNTIAMGKQANANAKSAVAMGVNAKAEGQRSFALGSANTAKLDELLAKDANGEEVSDEEWEAATPKATTATGADSIAMGTGAQAMDEKSIAIGADTKAITAGVAIGKESETDMGVAILGKTKDGALAAIYGNATGAGSIAVGGTVDGIDSIAIGNNTSATGDDNVVIGNVAFVKGRAIISIGTGTQVNNDQGIGLGDNTTIFAEQAIAIGAFSNVSENANQAVAIGYSSVADKANSVAIGANSKTNKDFKLVSASSEIIKGTKPNSITTTFGNFAGTATGVVSVGNVGSERQIINVAPGEVSATSTDAINGSQLFAVADQVVQNAADIKEGLANISFDFVGDVASADNGKTEFTRTNKQKITVTGGAQAVTAKSGLSEGNIGVVVDDSTGTLAIKLAKNLNLTADGGLTVGTTTIKNYEVKAANTTINADGITTNKFAITGGPSMDVNGINAGNKVIKGVSDAKKNDEAVNLGQLTTLLESTASNVKFTFAGDVTTSGATDTAKFDKNSGDTIKITGGAQAITDTNQLSEGNIGVVVDTQSGELAVKLAKELNLTQDGSITMGKTVLDGNKLEVAGTTIDDNGISTVGGVKITKDGINAGGKRISGVANGVDDTDAVNVSQLRSELGTAVADVGLSFAGDAGEMVKVTNGNTLNIYGGVIETDKLVDGNIGVIGTDKGLSVQLAKDLTGLDSVTTGNTIINNDGLAVKGKDGKDGAVITNDGLAIKGEDGKDKVVVKGDKVDMGGNVIHNVGAGEAPSDAVNRGQLDAVSDRVDGLTGDLGNLNGRVNKLGNRVNKVGAGAAALAALSPLDFNPDDKWNFAVGYGNYKNADAVAIGAYYQPNEDTRFSVGGTVGSGENMINAGLSIRFGQTNGVSTSRVALAKDVETLKRVVQQLVVENEQLRRGGQGLASGYPDISEREFPDVPKNHWAYEYVDTIAKKGLTIGYPDGEFKGDRTLTRYEFAAVVYRALKNGAEIDAGMARAIDEFGPEIARLEGLDHSRVDRVAGEDNDRYKIERVRVNNKDNEEKGDYRDIFGGKIQKEEVAQ